MAALQKLTDEFLTCIVCKGVYKDPATLHCGHSFCSACITSYVLSQPEAQAEKSIPCPHCRGLTKVPDPQRPVEEWARQLKTGFFVKGLVETFVAEENTKDPVLCSVCKEDGKTTPADKWCSDCNEALCFKCLQLHTQYPKFREHKTADITDGLKQQQSDEKNICPEHKDEKLKLFCNDCDVKICQLCCSIFHRKCDSVVTLTEAYPQMKQELANKVFDMQFAIVKSESVFSERKFQLNKLMESCDKAVSDVDAACEAFIQVIQTKQAKLQKNISKKRDHSFQLLTTDMETADLQCKRMERDVGTIQRATQSATETELYDTYKEYCSKNKPESPDKDRLIEINFNSNIDQLTKSLHSMNIGTLDLVHDKTETRTGNEVETYSKKAPGARAKHPPKQKRQDNKRGTDIPRTRYVLGPGDKGGLSLSSKFKSEENLSSGKGTGRQRGARSIGPKTETDDYTEAVPVLVDHIDVKSDTDRNDPLIEDIITVPDGDSTILVLSDVPNRKVKAMYLGSGEKLFLEFLQPPGGLTQVSDNEVAVTVSLSFRVYIMKLRPHLQIVFHFDTKAGYTHICYLDGIGFAAASGTKVIDILDSSGSVTKRLENEQISKPILYKANIPGQIIVCDPDMHSVTRMTISNKRIFKYQPYGKHRLVNTFGVTLNNRGNLYIVNRGCNEVVMLGSTGNLIKTVLSMDASIEKLAYIAFDKRNRMYLTFEDKYICVYQL